MCVHSKRHYDFDVQGAVKQGKLLNWDGYLDIPVWKVGCEARRNSFRETLEKERPGDAGASPLAR